MGEFIRFQLDIQLDEDLPGRVVTVLNFLAGNEELPENFKLPKARFFQLENWMDIFKNRLGDDACEVNYAKFDGKWLRAAGTDFGKDKMITEFLAWLFPYIERFEGQHCVGGYKADKWAFPTMIVVSECGMRCIDLDDIFVGDTPVFVHPKKLMIHKLPEPKEISPGLLRKMLESVDMDALAGMLGVQKPEPECENCGECEDAPPDEIPDDMKN